MAEILVLARLQDADLHVDTARVLSAARALAPRVDVLLCGHEISAAARQAAMRLEGVRRVLLADDERLAEMPAEPTAALLRTLASGYAAIIGATCAAHRNVLPRLAGLLGAHAISDVIAIEAPDRFVRPMHAGAVMTTLRVLAEPAVVLVRASAFKPAAAGDREAPLRQVEIPPSLPTPARVERRPASKGKALETADIVLGMGRGLAGEEGRAALKRLAERLDAAIGATRAAVDELGAPYEWQVGQTGKSIAPRLYMAFGISGAQQHLAGIRDSELIVAINTDEQAPIFRAADYGLVMDAAGAATALLKRLEENSGT